MFKAFSRVVISLLFITQALSLRDNSFGSFPDLSKIKSAFATDNWTIVQSAATKRGGRGFLVESTIATTLDSGKPKKAYYLEGAVCYVIFVFF
jgi:hypothetical protein